MKQLNCSRLRKNARGEYKCHFVSQDQSACNSCIGVPSAQSLLDGLKQQKDKQSRRIRDIRDSVEKNRDPDAKTHTTLVLGAGVSIPAGMPDWLGLVSQMSGYAMQYNEYMNGRCPADPARMHALEKALIDNQVKILNGINVLEAGQYVKQALETVRQRNGDELIKGIVSSIIKQSQTPEAFLDDYLSKKSKMPQADYLSLPEDERRRMREELKDKMRKRAALRRSIAARNTLCAVSYVLERGFRRALTYNYDTLVQDYLIRLFRVPEKSILTHADNWTRDISTERDPIKIFHVHGCVPRAEDCGRTPAYPKESARLILSEDSYYETERYGAYNWQNSIQSYYLNRDHCVFIGFSADDYNFRRILRQLGEQRHGHPEHYLILTIDSLVKETWKSVCRLHFGKSTAPEDIRKDTLTLLERELEMKEQYWDHYNFYPIWATIPDIPRLLLSLI